MKTTIDPQLLKVCADKGAEAANTHPSLQGTTYLTIRDAGRDFQASHPDFSLIEGSVAPADPEVGLPERVISLAAYSKTPPFELVGLTNEQFLECEQLLIDEFHASD